jgi:hypothetical protein
MNSWLVKFKITLLCIIWESGVINSKLSFITKNADIQIWDLFFRVNDLLLHTLIKYIIKCNIYLNSLNHFLIFFNFLIKLRNNVNFHLLSVIFCLLRTEPIFNIFLISLKQKLEFFIILIHYIQVKKWEAINK